jgi:exoribonuclease-2
MFVLYEEDGDIKAGTILADNDSSLQVESQHGKRAKVKANNVLLRYAAPTPTQVMEQARAAKEELDLDFLWEVAGEAEFGFEDLAREYHGQKPSAPETTAILLALHGAPIYFHKKGKGRYRAAPADVLTAAKAAVERKARETAQRAEWADHAGRRVRTPRSLLRAKVFELAHKPDKNSLEYKALIRCLRQHRACPPVRLLDKCGAIPSSHEFHLQAFLLDPFPASGVGFSGHADAAPEPPPELPAGDAPAFSIDDAATTEIDDAFSVIFQARRFRESGYSHRRAGPGHRAGQRPRPDRRDPAVDGVHARRQDHHAPRGPGGAATPWRRTGICPALSLYVDVAPDMTASAVCHTQADTVYASPPICVMKPWSRCSTRTPSEARRRPIMPSGANWNGSGDLPAIWRRRAARPIRCSASTISSRSRTTGCASSPGYAAIPSTS